MLNVLTLLTATAPWGADEPNKQQWCYNRSKPRIRPSVAAQMMIEWLQFVDLEVAKENAEEPMPEWLFWTYAGISAALVAMAGLMSGLTLGLMSLDEIDLEVRAVLFTAANWPGSIRLQPLNHSFHAQIRYLHDSYTIPAAMWSLHASM